MTFQGHYVCVFFKNLRIGNGCLLIFAQFAGDFAVRALEDARLHRRYATVSLLDFPVASLSHHLVAFPIGPFKWLGGTFCLNSGKLLVLDGWGASIHRNHFVLRSEVIVYQLIYLEC